MADKIQIRRGTATQWTSANPVLADGEPALETDTGKTKIGKGLVPWSGLSYEVDRAQVAAIEEAIAEGRVFSVTAYGAVGDGVTNDTTACRAAHAAAQAAGGGVIFYPGPGATPTGTYKVIPDTKMFIGLGQNRYAALGLASDCHMLGSPGARILCPVGASGHQSAGRWLECTVVATDSFADSGVGNADRWSIRNLIFDEGASTGLEAYSMQIMIGACDDWTIADCTFQNFQGDSIGQITDFGSFSRGWRITRNHFKNGGGNPIVNFNAADFWIEDNYIEGPVFSGSAAEAIITDYSNTVSVFKHGTIKGNIVINWGDINVGYGTDWNISDNIVILPSGAAGACIRIVGGARITVANNVLDGSLGNTGVLRFSNYSITKMAITGNIMKGGAGGTNPYVLHVQPASGTNSDWTVVGNQIEPTDPTGPAVYMAADGLIFANNTIAGSGNGNVTITAGARAVVTGNRILGYLTMAISTDAVISSNRINSPIYYAILSGGGSIIIGNYLRVATASAVTGVVDLSGSGSVVTGNRLETTVTNSYWLFEKAGATGNAIDNNIVVVGAGVAKLNLASGSTSSVRNKVGYVTEKRGAASVADGGTISHGLAAAPTTFSVTATAAGRQVAVTAVSATMLTVSLTDSGGTPIAVAENVQWRAEI